MMEIPREEEKYRTETYYEGGSPREEQTSRSVMGGSRIEQQECIC